MRKYLSILSVMLGCISGGLAQEFAVNRIPDELMKDASAVVRLSEESYELLSASKAVYRVHTVITILNKKADGLAYVYYPYSNLSKIKEMEAVVYDKSGAEIDKLKKSDITDESFISGFSLYEDTRVKYADMTQPNYPYTVESTIEVHFDYLYGIPGFIPQPQSNVSVQRADYVLRAPTGLFPRFKEDNFSGKKTDGTEGNLKFTRWEITDIPVFDREAYGYSFSDKAPRVVIAPAKFEYDGFAGDMSTWDSYAHWLNELFVGRNTLSENTKKKLQAMTRGMSDREKAKTVYEYMQSRTRYVSIQDGIGGLQPFESGLVDEVGYGDCKALSFYTKSMLEAVGVKSEYALIYGGNSPAKFYDDFAFHFGNHAILAVPLEADTVYLECTSQTKPFGYMGNFTDDRDVVLVTENGAVLTRTPRYDHTVNTQIRKAKIDVSEEGLAEARISTTYRGLQYENGGLSEYVHLGHDKQEKWVHNNTDISSYELVNFTIENRPDILPEAEVSLDLKIRNVTTASGKRIFFTPNLMNKVENTMPKIQERHDPVFVRVGSFDIDTLVYTFPSNLRPEFIPEPTIIESRYGYYETSFDFRQGELKYIRIFKYYEGTYPAEEYQDIFDFRARVEREDLKKVVLLKGT